jgi:CRP-like cAMP-binding protein
MKIENYGEQTLDFFSKGIFAHLSVQERIALYGQQTTNKFKKGQIIFERGNHPPGIYCIISGNIKLTKDSFDGKHSIIRIMREGDIFGYDSIFLEKSFGANAVALEDATLYFIDKKYVLEILSNKSQVSFDLIVKLTQDMAAAEAKIVSFNQKNVRERLAELLYELSLNYGVDDSGRIRINIKLTREEMASIIGTANETLIRFMTEFKDNKLIEQSGKTIYVINQSKLRDWAKFPDEII